MTKDSKFDFMILKNYNKERKYIILKPFKSSVFDRIAGIFGRK